MKVAKWVISGVVIVVLIFLGVYQNSRIERLEGGVRLMPEHETVTKADLRIYSTLVIAASDSRDKTKADYVCDGVLHELVVEDCEAAWDEYVDPNVTSELDNVDFKVGTGSAKLTMADGVAANAILATNDVTPKDLSSYRSKYIWLKSTIATTKGQLQLLLDAHPNCVSPEETLDIPALPAGSWLSVCLKLKNPASDSAIISIGIKQVPDLGVFTLNIDDSRTMRQDDKFINDAIEALPISVGTWEMEGAVAYDADDATPYDDETNAANEATANDMTLLPAVPAVNDAYYFGGHVRFPKLTLKIGTPGVGTWTITWEYWDGAAWTALPGVTDGTNGFRAAAGNHDVTWDMPINWEETEVMGITALWIRARVSAYTGITTQPKGTQSWIEVATGGGGVALLEGHYIIAAPIYMLSGVGLFGQGSGTELKLKDSHDHSISFITNADVDGGNYHITIFNLQVDGNKGNNDAYGNEALQHGIEFIKVSHSHVHDCWIYNTWNGGISSIYSSHNVIANNDFLYNVCHSIIFAYDSNYNRIEGNRIHRCTTAGIGLWGSRGNTVIGNIITRSGDYGIQLLEEADYNTITGNDLEQNGKIGILLSLNTTYGCSHNVVANNIVKMSGEFGIAIVNGSHHNQIIGNTCIANGQKTDNSYDNIVLNINCDYNLIASNICRRGALTNKSRQGIQIFDAASEYNIIHGNDLYDSGSTGDLLDNGTGTLKRDNRANAGNAWLADV